MNIHLSSLLGLSPLLCLSEIAFLHACVAFRQLRLQLIDLEHISLIRTFRKGKETVFIFIKSIKTYSCHICSRTVSRHARYNVVTIV